MVYGISQVAIADLSPFNVYISAAFLHNPPSQPHPRCGTRAAAAAPPHKETSPMYPKNAWYVACTPDEIAEKPLGRTICSEKIVFYRPAPDQVAALDDFCPHRGAPLSLGTVCEGHLQCGYHGLRVECTGKSVSMPGQRVQGFPKARSFPVVERYGFIWVWPGDADKADPATIHHLPWANNPEWAYGGGLYHIACDYRLMIDNLMDLTHGTSVHSTSIGQKEIDEVPCKTRVEGDEVITSRFMENIEAPPFWQMALRMNGLPDDQPVDRWQICRFSPPSHVMIEVGVAVADLFTGLYATVAIQAALRHAERTGEGQHIDMALLDVGMAILANQAAGFLNTGAVPQRMGNSHPSLAPYQDFPTADGAMLLAIGNDGQFQRFCAAAEQPQWAADPRYATNTLRVQNRTALIPAMEAVTRTRTTAEWIALLEDKAVPCGPINTIAQAFDDAQVQARGLAVTLPRWKDGEAATDKVQQITGVASPLRLSATPPVLRNAPPALGQHTDEVLAEMGLDAARIAALRAQGVVLPQLSTSVRAEPVEALRGASTSSA
eukprot:gene14671-31200_t